MMAKDSRDVDAPLDQKVLERESRLSHVISGRSRIHAGTDILKSVLLTLD